ncbi:MAG: small multi-drug export protein [Lachnospiraceae bacterium]|nr:small multi-drug export protein [Lachnospiraceae bacterium]
MHILVKYLLVFLVSMVPLVELRGAIPMAVGWGLDSGWQLFFAYVAAILGNMLPVPFIYFFARKILEWGKDKKFIGKFFTFCLNKGHNAGKKLMKKGDKGFFLALVLFVGIPIPGTGAWTGTLGASILDAGFKKSSVAVMLGVILAGIIMGVLSLFIKGLFY